jgi:Glu-tRNA(Gln) amidotransferase subunit E-like FAD-binding protein
LENEVNAPALASILRDTSTNLRADNLAAARVEEQRFDAMLKAYIDNDTKRFAHGGIHNLLMTIGTIMADRSLLESDDYEKAANFIYDAASACDMKYAEPEHPFSGSCGRD